MPDWRPEVQRRLAGLDLPPLREAEVALEVAEHLEDRYAELRRTGIPDADARRLALDEIADEEVLRRGLTETRVTPTAPPTLVPGQPVRGRVGVRLWQDVRYGTRTLLRRPGFAVAAVLALALGIGANSAIFAAVDAVLLRPMPFAHADRLYVPTSVNVARHIDQGSVTFADVQDWRAATDVFAAVALWRPIDLDLIVDRDPQRVEVEQVSDDFFRVLDTSPIAGRLFLPDDHEAKAADVAVLTYTLWQRAFGGADVVGRTVRLADVPVQIVGVLPPRIAWPNTAQMYVAMKPANFSQDTRTRRDNMIFLAVARLQDGVTFEAANARLASMAARLEHDEPVIRKGWTNTLVTLRDNLVDADLRVALFVLLGAVAAVLLIACANVANLALVRGSGRAREFAVRVSLGASRTRLIQQLVVESLLVTAAGAAAGCALAVPIMRALVAMAPPDTPFLDDVHLSGRMLLATAAASAIAVVISGVLPALSASIVRVGDAMRDGAAGSGVSRRSARLRNWLVIGEVAATVVLLTGAALLIRSFGRLTRVDPGLDVNGVVVGRLAIPSARYQDNAARAQFVQQLTARLEAAPDIEAAALTSFVPVGGGGLGLGRVFLAEGRPGPPAGSDVAAQWNVVTPDYFRTLGIPLRQGRAFGDRDTAASTPVIIVSASFASRMFPGENPIGKRVRSWRDENLLREVVGVAAEVKYRGLSDGERPLVYVPHTQNSWGAMLTVVRARRGDEAAVIPTLRQTVQELDPQLAISDIRSLSDVARHSISGQRYAMLLLTVLAGTALLLAAIGIYGVTSYMFALRRRELGIRLALGATRRDLYALVFRHGLGLTAAGLALGVLGSAATVRVLANLLFDTSPADATAWAAMLAVVAVAAVAACLLPARRAASANPTGALRAD